MATVIHISSNNKQILNSIKTNFEFFEKFKLFKPPEKISVWRQDNSNEDVVYLPFNMGYEFFEKSKTKNVGDIKLSINSTVNSSVKSKDPSVQKSTVIQQEDLNVSTLASASASVSKNKYLGMFSNTPLDLPTKKNNSSLSIPTQETKQLVSSKIPNILNNTKILNNNNCNKLLPDSRNSISYIENTSITKADFEFKGELREYQKNFYKELHDRKLMSETIPCSLIDVYPGFGKTIVGCKTSADIGLLTCILTPLKFLETSWVNVYKSLSNARVWIVGDKKSTKEYTELFEHIDELCINKQEIDERKSTKQKCYYWTHDGYSNIYVPDVIICMIDRVEHIPSEIIQRIGTLIIDEAHMFCTDHRISNILKFFPKYLMCLTATPIRSDGKNKMLEYLVGDNCQITRLPPKYKIIKCNTNIQYTIPKKKMYNARIHDYSEVNDFSGYMNAIEKDDNRNNIIAKLCKTLLSSGRKVIVMGRQKNHIHQIQKHLNSMKISNDYVMGTKDKYKDSSVLMGTMPKMGTGFDEANVCEDFKGVKSDTLILASTVKEPAQLYQLMGRVFRSDDPLIIFLHDIYDTCDKHWKENLKLLNQHDTTIEECDCQDLI